MASSSEILPSKYEYCEVIKILLDKSYNEKTLSYICEYLHELCSIFNKFYSETNILKESNLNKKETYIALLHLVLNVCTTLLDVLAIEIPDKM